MVLVHRLSAVLATLALLAGNLAVCAGWAATPEERMSCCAKGATCPMRKPVTPDSKSSSALTQAQADSCCASSEGRQQGPVEATIVAATSPVVLGPAIILTPPVPPLLLRERGRIPIPVGSPPVARHLLLSVFLV